MIQFQRLWDKRFDGHRFCFIEHSSGEYTTIKDSLNEFKDTTLPTDLAIFLAEMLGDLHQLQIDKKMTTGHFKSLIEIAENTDLDKDVLITCIKYGANYKNNDEVVRW